MALPRPLRRGLLGQPPGWVAATLALLLVWYVTQLGYAALNHGPSRIFLETAADRWLPVVPIFVIPYVSLTPLVIITMLASLLLRADVFRRTAVAMIVAWLLSFTCYVLIQSFVVRPTLVGSDAFTAMIRSVYAGDNPFNAFPSLHTSLSAILAAAWWRFDRRAGMVAASWTALIVASTVLIKQHYLADLVGGLLVAAIGWRLSGLLMARIREPETNASSG